MSIKLKTHKLLWGKSGNRCAICRKELYEDATLTDDEALIGEECHIVAKEDNGPRGKNELSLEDRDKSGNLILFCRDHHKIIDSQVNEYTVEKLRNIKTEHEEWVKKSLSIEIDKNELLFLDYIDKWIEKAHIYSWTDTFAGITYTTNYSINKNTLEDFEEIDDFLFRRFRNDKYIEIEKESDNFRKIIHDLISVFRKHIDFSIESEESFYTERFYKISEWNKEKYDYLLEKYNFHTALLDDLVLELSRSGNRIINLIRENLVFGFMHEYGHLMLHRGADMELKEYKVIPKYRNNSEIYPGLLKFSTERESRDFNIGHIDRFIKEYL